MDTSSLLRQLSEWGWLPATEPVFWTALLLVGGALAGEAIARTTRLPRIVGYTVAGCAAACFGVGPAVPLTGTPRLILDVALALLLFEIGSRVRLRWLRFNLALLVSSLAESAGGAAAVFLGLRWIDVDPWVAAACAVLAMPASAAMAGRVSFEVGAEGQVTDRMTVLTALNTLYAALALVVLKVWFHAQSSPDPWSAMSTLGYSFFGSLLLAALLAAVVAVAVRRLDLRSESSALLVLGLVLLAVSAARLLGLSTLLVPLMAGMTLRNSTDRAWAWPRHFGTAGGVLVLLLFVIVGASWTPQILAAGGVAALVLVAARTLAKGLAVLSLSRWSGVSARQGLALAATLAPLSSASLVMLADLYTTSPGLAAGAMPIVIASLAMLELAAPIAIQSALSLAGELSALPPPPRVRVHA